MAQTEILVPGQYALGRAPRTDEELYWAIYAIFGVKVPRTPVCAHHSTPFAALSESYFARSPVSIWHGSRGYGGKSYTLSILVSIEAAFMGAQCALLGGSGAQSLNVQQHVDGLWTANYAPKNLLLKQNKYSTQLINHGHIRALMASMGSVRGPHPQRLRLDEIDEMDLPILDASLGQPMRKRGIETQITMSSTWQYPDGTMTEVLRRAEANGWPVHSWCYKETMNPVDGWLSPDEVDAKRRLTPHAMWEAEYDLQEPSFENRAIDPELLNKCFDPDLGEFDDMDKIRVQEAHTSEMYVTGADWAQSKDLTEVVTFRLPQKPGASWELVAYQAFNRLPWPVTIKRAFDQWDHYGGRFVHDGTGLGRVVNDSLRELCHDHHQERQINSVTMSRNLNHAMFTEYVSALERTEIKFPVINRLYDEHRYCSIDDLYGRGHAPDGIVACALAWTERKNRIGKIAAAQSTPKVAGWKLN